MSIYNILHVMFSALIGGLTYLFGGFDIAMKTMLFMTIFDFVTGVGTSIYNRDFASKKCTQGIIKKVYIYFTVMLAYQVQKFTGGSIPIRETVIMFYIFSEGFSCLENIGKVVEYPKKLREVFEQLKEEYE